MTCLGLTGALRESKSVVGENAGFSILIFITVGLLLNFDPYAF